MSPDAARREARLMAETLASQAHQEAHDRIRQAVRDRGSSSILLLLAALPIIALVVYAMASLAGAVAGIETAGGAR